MRLQKNPNHGKLNLPDYKDLGYQNGWKSVYKDNKFVGYDPDKYPEWTSCRKQKHTLREFDNSFYSMRGTDVIYICDVCKHYSHVDMSD